jgi:hypothetical protein
LIKEVSFLGSILHSQVWNFTLAKKRTPGYKHSLKTVVQIVALWIAMLLLIWAENK